MFKLTETGKWLLTGGHIVRDVVCCSSLCWKRWDFTQKLKLGAGFHEPSSGLLSQLSRVFHRHAFMSLPFGRIAALRAEAALMCHQLFWCWNFTS